MESKAQSVQDIRVKIHSINDDGTDNTGDAANLSTIVIDPAGNELAGTTDYTEATFNEIGATGEYECLFLAAAGTPVFTSVDQNNPYRAILVSSTGGVGSSGQDIQIVSRRVWELPTVAEIWAYTTRTLTSFGTLVSDIVDAVTAVCALETTSQEILAQVTGTGNRVITIHVEDAVAAPIADVLVRVGTASTYTDPAGDAVFALDDGDYDVILRKDFVTFTVPEALTVSGDGTHDYTGAVFAPSVPTQPDTCVVFGIVTDNSGAPVGDAEIFANTVDDSTFAGELKIVKNQSTESAADGTWQLELIRNSELAPDTSYQVIICNPSFKFETTITVPDQDSVEFSTIKGT